MSIKRLLNKYKKIQQKAIKIHKKIENYYIESYLNNDILSCKEYLNAMYGIESVPKDIEYSDTDSIIYSDFNKKQEI